MKMLLTTYDLTPKKPNYSQLKVLLNLVMKFHYGFEILLMKSLLLYDSFPFQELATSMLFGTLKVCSMLPLLLNNQPKRGCLLVVYAFSNTKYCCGLQ